MNPVRRRSAMTLVELLIAMFVATALLGTLAAVVSRILRSDTSGTAHLETMVRLSQLGEQLRRDGHDARDVRVEAPDGQPRVLRLAATDGRTIRYTVDDHGVDRAVSHADQIVSRDRFQLPAVRCLAWHDEIAASRRVSLVAGRLARQGDEPAAVTSKFTIAVALSPVPQPEQP